ncbi:MAG: glycosyltransferase, partial [Verrucomicrobiota bacterium]
MKNERHVIARCLDSLMDMIDYWVIVDTGSTDGTQAFIRDYLQEIPGELIERPWVDFAHNRTEALVYARGKADYIFTIDADEILRRDEGLVRPVLTDDSYLVEFHSGPYAYYKCQFAANRLNWRYNGVLHEYIHCDEAEPQAVLPGFRIDRYTDGARSSDPHKYRKDALILERALIDEPDNHRHVFYLAQSYRDAGDFDEAIRYYTRRSEMENWDEEVWFSLFQIAELKGLRGDPWPEREVD